MPLLPPVAGGSSLTKLTPRQWQEMKDFFSRLNPRPLIDRLMSEMNDDEQIGKDNNEEECNCGSDSVEAPTWPETPEEMDDFLGIKGEAIPDGPTTPGRNKKIWRPNQDTKITHEGHPYHPDAPDSHRLPHWHLDTPKKTHETFVPGQRIPGRW